MKSKMVGLFAVVILALAVAGMAYASWVEWFTIGGNVWTGNFDVDVSATLDGYYTPHSNSPYPIVSSSNQNGGGGVYIAFDKAFPGCYVTANVQFKNNGNLPANVSGTVSLIVSENGPIIDPTGKIEVTFGGANPPDIGDVIPAGGTQSFTVTVRVLDNALESATYTIALGFGFSVSTP
jgi:hypothetical protein